MKVSAIAVASIGYALLASAVALAGNCCVDTACVYSTSLNTGLTPFASLCGHTISGSGATCTVTMQQDESLSSGSCVTLADRVTLDMNGHTITCTGSCGTAIDDTDTTTSNPVKIQGGGKILGCWNNGATAASDSYNSTITDVHIDLVTGSCNGNNGIGPYKTVTRVSVGGATGTAVDAGGSTSIVDSIIHNSTVGVKVRAISSSVGTDISGSLIYNSLTNVQTMTTVNGSGGPQTLTDSTVLAGTCNFRDFNGNCGAAVNTIDLNGINFVDTVSGGGISYDIVQ